MLYVKYTGGDLSRCGTAGRRYSFFYCCSTRKVQRSGLDKITEAMVLLHHYGYANTASRGHAPDGMHPSRPIAQQYCGVDGAEEHPRPYKSAKNQNKNSITICTTKGLTTSTARTPTKAPVPPAQLPPQIQLHHGWLAVVASVLHSSLPSFHESKHKRGPIRQYAPHPCIHRPKPNVLRSAGIAICERLHSDSSSLRKPPRPTLPLFVAGGKLPVLAVAGTIRCCHVKGKCMIEEAQGGLEHGQRLCTGGRGVGVAGDLQ